MIVESTTFEAFVSASTGKPFIEMTCSINDKVVFTCKMSPALATALGLRAIQSAIEAERDSGFIKFLRDQLELSDEGIAAMLSGMRDYRQQFDAEAGSMRPLSVDDKSRVREE